VELGKRLKKLKDFKEFDGVELQCLVKGKIKSLFPFVDQPDYPARNILDVCYEHFKEKQETRDRKSMGNRIQGGVTCDKCGTMLKKASSLKKHKTTKTCQRAAHKHELDIGEKSEEVSEEEALRPKKETKN